MGSFISRWRKKPSTQEILKEIQGDISGIMSFKRDTQASHKKLIGHLFAYFALLYVLAAIFTYFRYYHEPEWAGFQAQFLLWIPFLVAPVIFLLVKKVLTWWYHRKIARNETKLGELQKKKKKILDEVMETETYKVAKEILEKYAPEQLGHNNKSIIQQQQQQQLQKSPVKTPALAIQPRSTPMTTTTSTAVNSSVIRDNPDVRRRLNVANAVATPSRTPFNSSLVAAGKPSAFSPTKTPMSRSNPDLAPGPPLPRPVLARDRGYMDRMVEYLVGDGPSNRYALICKQCQSHNGMALKEEFEYIAYRCCYCHFWNPARKQRPVAPRLDTTPSNARRGLQAAVSRQSSTESSSSSSSDDEKKVTSSTPPAAAETEDKKEESSPLTSLSKETEEDKIEEIIKQEEKSPTDKKDD